MLGEKQAEWSPKAAMVEASFIVQTAREPVEGKIELEINETDVARSERELLGTPGIRSVEES